MQAEETMEPQIRSLYRLAGVSALIAMAANLLDVILGIGCLTFGRMSSGLDSLRS